jgi:glycosyltransferase involved in cell wall biosynthesis
MSPQTTVIIPVRNGARFIAEAVQSALRQLAAGDEVVVVDDASTDATLEVVGGLDDPRIHVLAGTGRGVSSARNIGLAAARGEFIAFLDHDDLWPADRHAELLQVLRTDSGIDCAVGRIRLQMESDAIWIPRLVGMDGQLSPMLSLCTALFRRRVLERAGSLDEGMRFGEDTDYLVRLTELGCRFVLCDVDTLIYRRHGENATCDARATEDGFMDLIRRRRIRNAAPTRDQS